MILKRFIPALLIVTAFFYSCEQHIIDKPDHLIPQEKMVDILYDLSLLSAVKGVDVEALRKRNINPSEFLYKKYHIDSTKFTQSALYYASSNPEEYAKMFEEVKKRLENQNQLLQDSIEAKQRRGKQINDSLIGVKRNFVKPVHNNTN